MAKDTQDSKPLVLVTGGTGKQGGATVRQLLAGARTRIRVITRTPRSPKAQSLAARGVQVVGGSFDDPDALKAALDGVSAAFSVQSFTEKGGIATEERQGKAFANAVKSAGGAHLVYSSVDGAERRSGVPHFESKWRIERHIADLGLPTTILRPVAFMDNFAVAGFPRAMFLGMLKATLGTEKRLQLVSVDDVGWFAARALETPKRYEDRRIAIAGDNLNVAEILAAYHKVAGTTPGVVPIPRFLPQLMLPRDIFLMLKWFADHGYQADIESIRKECPAVASFETWLRRQSGMSLSQERV
jgi:uncharacterized protein YbjT (DUF2867 family)